MTAEGGAVRFQAVAYATTTRLRTIRPAYDGQLPQWGSCWLVILEVDDPDQPMAYPTEMPLFEAPWAWCPS